jgi:hypothetical protein
MTDEPPIPPPEALADPPIAPREALANVRVRAPTRGNRKLERLLQAANADEQLKAWWHVSAVNATRRLGMSDHSWGVKFVSSPDVGPWSAALPVRSVWWVSRMRPRCSMAARMAVREPLAWSDEVRAQVGARSMAMSVAMDDVLVQDHEAARAWVELHEGQVILYVAEPGCLHRLCVPENPRTPLQAGNESRDLDCEYQAFPITQHTTYVVKVTVTQHNYTRLRHKRTWTFDVGAATPIKFDDTAEDYENDPSGFARHLAGLVAKAYAGTG